MEPRMKQVLVALEVGSPSVRMIGIKGLGGGGKTTLARAIFNEISIHFEGACFVENVRQVLRNSSLQSLQTKILKRVLNEFFEPSVDSVHEGKMKMKSMLCMKKVLLVLDDVDHISQLEALAGSDSWFGQGSRIIITTRDEQVLVAHKVKHANTVSLLNVAESIQLFSRYAFGADAPIQGYEEHSLLVVKYAAGLPLALKVLGSFLCGGDMEIWTDTLDRLKKILPKEILDILEISYGSLEEDQKEIFLHIACFFNGWSKDEVLDMMRSCELNPVVGLRVLEQKSLLTIIPNYGSSDGRHANMSYHIQMHDLVQEMGRNIVRRMHPNEPNRRSRLWNLEEIRDIVVNYTGTEETKALVVSGFQGTEETKALVVSGLLGPGLGPFTKGFRKMTKLKLLSITFGTCPESLRPLLYKDRNVGCLLFLPDELEWFSCWRWGLQTLPRDFKVNKLVGVKLQKSELMQLWDEGEEKVLQKLKILDLSDSRALRTLDLRCTPNLEKLVVKSCYYLENFVLCSGGMRKLVYLNLNGCISLKSFSFLKQLESLQILLLSDLKLEEFPSDIVQRCNNSLLELYFRNDKLRNLPQSIGNLSKLIILDLSFCVQLRSLPPTISSLKHLKILKLGDCINLRGLPEELCHLDDLEALYFGGSRIRHLPQTILKLKSLRILDISNNIFLEELPDDLIMLECLVELNLSRTLIRDLPGSICMLKHLKFLDVRFCRLLERLPEDLGRLECLEEPKVFGTKIRYIPKAGGLFKEVNPRFHK